MKRVIIVAMAMLFSGCAFISQQADLQPVVSVMDSSEGSGVTVAVRILDERPSQSLGRRGSGYGPAAEISAAQDLAMVVHEQVVQGLKKKSFAVADYSEEEDTRLTVELRLLEYSTSVGFWTGGVHIRGAFKAIAIKGGETYQNMYRADKEKRVVVTPTAKQNEEWINATISDVLSRMFEDNALFEFLTE